ncbi:TetR/AcrR family transcriptional regulator [Brevundimonas sp. R86498]|uniref:TetR/AcrR family transcriptional regulator n=1 Tax=Brevundimonas sp. R86498 TaxID=3093845 RepID=UPI0037CC34B8
MSQPTETPTPSRRGRPRDEQSRQAILDAAYALLLDQGLGRLTVEAVALQARVGKPTIYRYWANAQELAMAALLSRTPADAASGSSGSAVRDLKDQVADVVWAFATPRGRQITLTLAAAAPESEIAKAFRNQIILRSRETGRELLLRAARQGEVRLEQDIDTILDLIYGPIFYRLLAGHMPLSPGFSETIIEVLLSGIGPAQPPPPR